MYEAPEVLALGEAHDLILGVKLFLQDYTDQEFVPDRAERVDDIDESDD